MERARVAESDQILKSVRVCVCVCGVNRRFYCTEFEGTVTQRGVQKKS